MASVHVGRLRGADGFSRLVALKRAHPHVKEAPSLANSMRTEAWLASRLHHTNVVSILDVEDDDGDLVLVLDYVEGCTLSSLLAQTASAGTHPREMVRVILDVAAGLHAAHRAMDEDGKLLGLVHRDVSPSNVLVGTDGVARVSDFGIAKAQFEDRDRTETGVLKGKASYMAPEYVLHQRATPASDLFSLGIVAWEALTGVRLFKGATEIDTLNRVVSATVHPMAEHDPRLEPLDEVVLRALSRLPEDRQASVDELAAELAAAARKHDLLGSHHEVSKLVERQAGPEIQERRRELAKTALSFVGTLSLSSLPASPATNRDEIETKTLQTTEEQATLLIEPPAPPIAPATFRQENTPASSGREKLGWIAALGLLVLALMVLVLKTPEKSAPPPVASVPPVVSSVVIAEEPPPIEVEPDASVPRPAPVSRPVHKRTYPAAQPALMPRKAPPNPYAK
jgi:serine/threonine-protein kinase